MKQHFKYAKYLARHKWFVFLAGLRLRVPLWRLVVHDWSKFLPCEWFPYAQFFYGVNKENVAGLLAVFRFDCAWLHHQHFNPHHWQHWVLREDSGATKLMEMPENFVREMVADWCGAGRVIKGKWDIGEWYAKNADNIQLHPITRCRVGQLLSDWERSRP